MAPTHAGLLEQGHPFRQWKTWTMPGTGLTLTGYSRANDKTFFHLPELKLGLDAGLVEGRQPETVLLTHTHLDHVKDLDFLAIRAGGVDIHVPAETQEHVRNYLRATTEVNQVAPYDPALAGDLRLHGVRPGDEVGFGRRGTHSARVFACTHKVPCVGYQVAERRRGLTEELAALQSALVADGRGAEFGKIVAARRAAGEAVDREITRPLFSYAGDTHAGALLETPWLFDAPVVITECTFLDDAELDRAKRIGHTVWSELRPIVEAHPRTVFVLIHFSLRHSDREVVRFFEREAAAGVALDNVVLWANPDSHLPQQHGA